MTTQKINRPLCLVLFALGIATNAWAVAFTPGNIVVSNSPFGDQDIFEFTTAGLKVQQIPVIPVGHGRDLVIDRQGNVQLYNGTFNPSLTRYNPTTDTFSSQTFAQWSTVGNLTYGGIGAFGQYLFVTDMRTNGGEAQGVVRFDQDGGPTVRFAEDTEPIDLSVGLDGLLYNLSRGSAYNGGGNRIDVYDPQTLDFIRTVILPEEHRGIAIDANGDIYTAQRDNVSRINRYDASGAPLDSILDPGVGGFGDIDINRNGELLIASHGGVILLTTTALDSIVFFQTRSSNGYNFAAWVQAPVPEPATLTLLGFGGLMAMRRRRA